MESSLQVGKVLLAISVFLTFVAWDVVKACKRGDKWIQGSGLTLTALTIQFLGYFDAQNVNLFGKSKEEELNMLLKKQLSVDISRLVFCIFLGCVLPGVAFNGSQGRWSNIAALAVSLCMHMATEVYVLQNVDDHTFRNGGGAMFISSSVLLLVAAISLVLYIGLAVINCKFARDRLSLGIPKMLSGSVESELLEGNEGEVFKLWAIVRGCQQEFWLTSSAFTPAVAMIVTTCVAVVGVKLISRRSLLHRINNSVTLTLCLECVFILTGWIILIWRWLIFLLLRFSYKSAGLFNYVGFTWVCGFRFCRLVYLLIRTALNLSPLDNVSHFECILTNGWKALRILVFFIFLTTMLPMGFFFVVICLLVLFNFFCWWLLKLLVYIAIKVAHAIHCIDMLKDLVSDPEVELVTETNEILYVADSSNKQTKRVMKEAYAKSQSSQKILKVIKHSVNESREVIRNQLSPTEDIYLYIGVWKMAAVAAISILAELANGWDSNEIVKDAVQAYKEAQDLLKFLDFPANIAVNPVNLFDSGNIRAYQMSLEADIKMQKIERLVETNKHRHAALTFKEVLEVVREFAENGQSSLHLHINFCQYWNAKGKVDELDYGEGTGDLKRFSMECMCKVISKDSFISDEKELIDRAVNCLGDIIAYGVLHLPTVLPEYCRKWAEEFKEENIRNALEIQEKFRAIEEILTPADTEPKEKPEENNLPEDTKVNVEEIETRKCAFIGAERDIGREIIDLQAK